ncbi:MAG: permease-like cell division protein FtsX [Candidatus Nanopelagicales bacterium]
MKFRYLLREVMTGLRRNITLTLAVMITVAVSLSLFGSSLLVRAQVQEMKDFWYDKVEVSIFLCGDISDSPTCAGGRISEEEKTQINADLEALKPLVNTIYFETQTEALSRFKEQFKNSPLAETATIDQMPESFRVKLSDPTQYAVIAAAFAGRPGVEDVVDQRQALDRLFRALAGLQTLALVIAGVMLLVTALLISNTMRVAAFSRRRETSIMRLVGASNFSIQLPFLLEAAVAALFGTTFATAALVVGKVYLIDQNLATTFTFTTFIGWDAVIGVIPWMLLAGLGLAVVAAGLTLQRYLKV